MGSNPPAVRFIETPMDKIDPTRLQDLVNLVNGVFERESASNEEVVMVLTSILEPLVAALLQAEATAFAANPEVH